MAHKKNSHQSRWSFHPISSFVLKELSQTICSADVTVGIQSLYSHSGLAATMVLGQWLQRSWWCHHVWFLVALESVTTNCHKPWILLKIVLWSMITIPIMPYPKLKKNISNLRRCVTLGITRIPHGFKQSLADTLRHELEKHLRKKNTSCVLPEL